ncbi:methyltransferase [Streptomyces sp. LHD-70]|uniref:methyltransferase n=1 Tax=Streptomyces sp. LHD-70 TaxID=3072140 RepID=UPI00280F47A0|nr:methyltransferase [Streptomyces sp. LHD-70]MDQ8706889.1 methyltransferase [Streptomyces sp. LHD-70]
MATEPAAAARRVVDIITGTWQAQALYASVALSLPDHIAAGRTRITELAEHSGTDPDALTRLLRLLTAMGVCSGSEQQGYALTEVGELLRSGGEHAMGDMVRLYGEEFHRAWGSVAEVVRTGGSGFEHAHGRSIHDHLREVPGAGAKFQRAMNAGNVFFPGVLEAFDFGRCRSVVDVAGGSGMLLSVVLQAHPQLHGTLFDLPHMVPVAREYLEKTVGGGRYETVSGDLFEQVPQGADAYLLSRVLQDWDDERCVRLLSHIRAALPEDGRLLILERVIDTSGATVLPLLWDLHLLMAAGGRERTLDGYRTVLADSGLRLESVHSLALETSLLVVARA